MKSTILENKIASFLHQNTPYPNSKFQFSKRVLKILVCEFIDKINIDKDNLDNIPINAEIAYIFNISPLLLFRFK